MDVVVATSKEEACSILALGESMVSMSFIVTENVGEKYLVNRGNGYIIKPGDIYEMKEALIKMIIN